MLLISSRIRFSRPTDFCEALSSDVALALLSPPLLQGQKGGPAQVGPGVLDLFAALERGRCPLEDLVRQLLCVLRAPLPLQQANQSRACGEECLLRADAWLRKALEELLPALRCKDHDHGTLESTALPAHESSAGDHRFDFASIRLVADPRTRVRTVDLLVFLEELSYYASDSGEEED